MKKTPVLPALLALVTLFTLLMAALSSCAPQPAPMVVIDGREISREEIDFVLSTTVEQYIMLSGRSIKWDEEIEGKPAAQYFRDQAIELALSAHVTETRALEMGIALSDEEKDEIDMMIALEAESVGGAEAFEAMMKDRYGSEEVYRYYYYTTPYLNQKLSDEIFGGLYEPSSEEIESFFARNYRCVSFLYITATDEEGQPMTGRERDTQRTVIEALRRELEGGADFAEMVGTHGQDYAMSLYPEGFPVAVGVNGDAFDAVMLALPVGGLSEVVEELSGFYLIKRVPDMPEWIVENHGSLVFHYLSEKYTQLVSSWRADAKVETTTEYEKIDPRDYEPLG